MLIQEVGKDGLQSMTNMTNNVKSYKKSMEKLKLPDPVFLPVDFWGSVLKTQKKTKKLRKLKHLFLKFFK